jgi:hypothetical protein
MGQKKDGPPMNSGSLGWMNVTARSKRIDRENKDRARLAAILRGDPSLYKKAVGWLNNKWPISSVLAAIQDEAETGKVRKRPARSKSQ